MKDTTERTGDSYVASIRGGLRLDFARSTATGFMLRGAFQAAYITSRRGNMLSEPADKITSDIGIGRNGPILRPDPELRAVKA